MYKHEDIYLVLSKYVLNIQCITKVSTPLTFLQIFKYISSWDNTDKMTLCAAYITELIYFPLKI